MLEVLQDRGYDVSHLERISATKFQERHINEEEDAIKNSMTIQVTKSLSKKKDKTIRTQRSETTTVIWPVEEKLGENVVGIIQKMGISDDWIVDPSPEKTHKAIVIIDGCITPTTKSSLKIIAKRGIRIDVYTLEESLFNVMKSVLVPKHRIISKKEEKELLREYGITKKDMPEIKITEPPMRHLSPERGNIIEIKRPSDTQPGEYTIYYRVVR